MRNRLLAFGMVAVMALSITACGKEEKKTEDTDTTEENTAQAEIEYDVNDYVTLGEYKGIEVTVEGEYEYTEEGFDNYVQQQLDSNALYVQDDSQTEVKEDSIVNVDYVGSQDGVAFDGGSAEDQMLDIANNSQAGGTTGFIDGFTAGLVGHSVGEEVAYEVTFPEEYQAEDLAGQTVIFTFQINYIAKAVASQEDLTDEIVSENFDFDTVDDYMASLKEEYETTLQQNLESDTETAVLNSIINSSTVSEVPEGLVQARVDLILHIQDLQYQAYGTSLKEYMDSMGYDYDEMVSSITESVKESTETELILEAIAEAEGIEVDEEGYQEFITPIITQMGFTDEEEFYSEFTVDGYGGERYFRLAYQTEKATDFCVENAVVNSTNTIAEQEKTLYFPVPVV